MGWVVEGLGLPLGYTPEDSKIRDQIQQQNEIRNARIVEEAMRHSPSLSSSYPGSGLLPELAQIAPIETQKETSLYEDVLPLVQNGTITQKSIQAEYGPQPFSARSHQFAHQYSLSLSRQCVNKLSLIQSEQFQERFRERRRPQPELTDEEIKAREEAKKAQFKKAFKRMGEPLLKLPPSFCAIAVEDMIIQIKAKVSGLLDTDRVVVGVKMEIKKLFMQSMVELPDFCREYKNVIVDALTESDILTPHVSHFNPDLEESVIAPTPTGGKKALKKKG